MIFFNKVANLEIKLNDQGGNDIFVCMHNRMSIQESYISKVSSKLFLVLIIC